jgi:hypothetical protein
MKDRTDLITKVATGVGVGAGVFSLAVLLFPNFKLLSLAKRELGAWNGLTENSPKAQVLLRKYWQATNQEYPGPNVAWSAAFIVYLANKAHPGSLARTASHMLYAGEAKKAKKGYVATPPTTPLRVGDIVVQNREGGTATFDSVGQGHVDSHGDIVMSVRDGVAQLLGGNVDNRIRLRSFPLSKSGALAVPGVITVLRYV